MAKGDGTNTSALNGLIRVVAQMMKNRSSDAAMSATDVMELSPEPVDCVALLDLIEAAQSLYAEACPIA